MRFTESLCKLYRRSSHRRFDLEFFKYQYYKDPILKNKVSGKGEKETRNASFHYIDREHLKELFVLKKLH